MIRRLLALALLTASFWLLTQGVAQASHCGEVNYDAGQESKGPCGEAAEDLVVWAGGTTAVVGGAVAGGTVAISSGGKGAVAAAAAAGPAPRGGAGKKGGSEGKARGGRRSGNKKTGRRKGRLRRNEKSAQRERTSKAKKKAKNQSQQGQPRNQSWPGQPESSLQRSGQAAGAAKGSGQAAGAAKGSGQAAGAAKGSGQAGSPAAARGRGKPPPGRTEQRVDRGQRHVELQPEEGAVPTAGMGGGHSSTQSRYTQGVAALSDLNPSFVEVQLDSAKAALGETTADVPFPGDPPPPETVVSGPDLIGWWLGTLVIPGVILANLLSGDIPFRRVVEWNPDWPEEYKPDTRDHDERTVE